MNNQLAQQLSNITGLSVDKIQMDKSAKMRDDLTKIFIKALGEAKEYLDYNMYDAFSFKKELDTYIGYIEHDVIGCITEMALEQDEFSRRDDEQFARAYECNKGE